MRVTLDIETPDIPQALDLLLAAMQEHRDRMTLLCVGMEAKRIPASRSPIGNA